MTLDVLCCGDLWMGMRNSQATRLLLVFSLAVGLLAGITLSLPQTSHAAELDTETWAVIIGVADYQNPGTTARFPLRMGNL